LNLPTKTAWRVPGFGKKEEPQLEQQPLPTFVPPPAEPAPVAAAAPAAPAWAAETSREPTLSGAVTAPETDVFKRPAPKSYAGWVLLVLLLSLAAFGFMYKELVLEEVEAFKKYLLRGTPAVAAPDEAASAAAAAAAASAEALAAAEQAASVASEAARVASEAEAVASAASALATTAAEPASAASASEKKASDKSVKSEVKVDAKADAKTEASSDSNSDEAWVNQLPTNGYVVQLAAMDTQDEMRSFQRSNAVYAKARIMRTRHKDTGKRFYILVAGPFETKTQADSFMQSSPLLAKGWLRSTKSMKTQFTKP
jgi:septal ring-binding cell division protein DamX